MAAAETDGGGGAGTRLYTEDGGSGGWGEVTSQTFIHTITFLLFLPWGTFNLLSQAQVHPTRRIKVPHRLYFYFIFKYSYYCTFITIFSFVVYGCCCGLDCSIRFSVDQFPSEIFLMFISLLHISHSDE